MIKHIVMWKFKENEEKNMKKKIEKIFHMKNIIVYILP